MGIVYKIQSFRRNQEKNYVSRSTLFCEISHQRTVVPMEENFFLKIGYLANEVIGCKRYSSSRSINLMV